MTQRIQTSDHAQTSSSKSKAPAASSPTFGRTIRLLAATLSLAIVALVGGAGAQSASASAQSAPTQRSSNAFGTLKTSKVTGHAKHGTTFVGRYHVTHFVVRNHKTRAVGRLTGTITRKSGATRHVSEQVRMPVNRAATRAANGPVPTSASAAQSAAVVSCEVLNLVLGPLDLNLLGLVVHLDRVVLNITAVPGAGALLGNLLCAIVGLLDGTGIGGLNAILTNLINAILGILAA